MFGDRLKLARKKAGYSLRGLSDALKKEVTAQAIGKYERGEMMPSSGVLSRLAKVLELSLEYLLSDEVEELEAVEFRKLFSTSAGARAQVEARVIDCLQRYLAIEEILDLDSGAWRAPRAGSPHTCDQVFDDFLAHCAARVAKDDMAAVTFTAYRRVLDGFWRPHLGALRFLGVRYSTLVEIADKADWSKKSYNNAISVLRRAFKFGYRDHPEQHDPTRQLKGARIQRKDRSVIDPFTVHEAETLIAALHRDWGEAQGNYDEFRFFTGLRPSEQIALLVDDFDAAHGMLCVAKARVAGSDKDSTKTGEDRRIVLCPRAIAVLKRPLALRAELERAGKIDHDHLFFKASGGPIRNLCSRRFTPRRIAPQPRAKRKRSSRA